MFKTKEHSTESADITDTAFKISLYLKGLNGLLETLGGLILLFIKPDQISRLARWLTQGELSQDPNDFLAKHVLKTAHDLTGASLLFGAAYLLSHGLVKIFLVVQVLRGRLWAYKVLIIVVGIFVIYQLYRLAVRFSIGMLLLTLFDIMIIYLTQKEYRRKIK